MCAEERLSAWNCGSDVMLVRSFVRCRLLPVFVSRLCEGREEKGGGCTNPSINTPVSLGRIRVMTVWMRCRGVG